MNTQTIRNQVRGDTAAPLHGMVQNTAEDRTLSHGAPSRSVLGLPLARLIPQDIHSVMDYIDGSTAALGMLLADEDDATAKITSIVLGAGAAGVSLMTDYRLSLAKVIPIEAHEVIDHVWGLTCIAAPFVLGYWKSSPRTAITHIAVGAGTILASLFTDYRSFKRR
jgi:hypothetical protein